MKADFCMAASSLLCLYPMSKKRFKFSLVALGSLAAFFMALIALFLAPTFASADKSSDNTHHSTEDYHPGSGGAPNPIYFEHSGWSGDGHASGGAGGGAGGGGTCVGVSCGKDKPDVQTFGGEESDGSSGNSGSSSNGSDGGDGADHSGDHSGQGGQHNGFAPTFFGGGGSSGGGNGGSSGGGGGSSGGGNGGSPGQSGPDGSGQGSPDSGSPDSGNPDSGNKGPDDNGDNGPGPQTLKPNSPPPGPPDLGPAPFEQPIQSGGTPSGDSDVGFPQETHKVPEPLTMSLFAVGLAGCAGMRRRRQGKRAGQR